MDQPPPIICSIVEHEAGDRLQLRGRIIGTQDAQGSFSLRVVKISPSGSSTMSQSGTFSAAANRETFVGLASFNMESGARFTAEFSLQVGAKTYTCESGDGGSKSETR